MRRLFLSLFGVALFVGSAAAQTPIPPDLKAYVETKDDSFTWKIKGKTESDAGTLYEIELVSQTWHDVKWDHGMLIALPKKVKPSATMVIWNDGGKPGDRHKLMAMLLAEKMNAPVAYLLGVPKQPLYDGKTEDALIAETFDRFLKSGDSTWPLLFPMVKSVVRGMDTVQAFAKQEWKADVTGFVVTGASKRGWTSWLTAASGDKRVKAIAPLVIDTLNFQMQMPNQLKSFGRYSEMIHDYEEKKLLPMPDTSEARKLWAMVDPWVYTEQLTLPKMIINGTNDPYWAQDALNLYWGDLKGEKYICYVPNAGHDLRAMEKPNQPNPRDAKRTDLLPMKAVNTLAAFSRHVVEGKAMPKISWKYTNGTDGVTLGIESTPAPKSIRKWATTSDTRDFRKSQWKVEKVYDTVPPGGVVLQEKLPAKGFAAVLAEVDYEFEGLTYTLTTQIKILEPKK